MEALRTFVGRGRARKAQIDGDLEEGDFLAGASAGLIKDVIPAADIIENFARSCAPTLRNK
jgi:enoyl-[acyl-carrier protein] reductase II